MANLLLWVIGALAEFERASIGEPQREGIAFGQAPQRLPRSHETLVDNQVVELRRRARAGEQKATRAREFDISRETMYQYLKMASKA